VLTFEALAGIITWLLTAGMLYCLYRQYVGKYKPPQGGLTAGEKVVQYVKNVDMREKMTQVKDSCTTAFSRRKHGSTDTGDANADEKDKHTTTGTLGSIFRSPKHRNPGTGTGTGIGTVDPESKRKQDIVPPLAMATGTEQRTGDNMV
jgi:hypothetical protein